MKTNILYYGDNLDVLRHHVKNDTVDLIYLDPPFNSNATYNVLFAEQNGSKAAAQIKAFEDAWCWDQIAAKTYRETIESGGKVAQFLLALRAFLGDNNMLAYLAMMAPRLVELRRVLKPTGSIYLHCDPTASHYLKMLMDAVFGAANFRNEIIWCYRQGGRSNKMFGRKHDTILFYSKTDKWIFNDEAVRIPYHGTGGYQTSGRGVTIRGKVYKPKPGGKIPEDWWDIPTLPPMHKERLGYPTQKPEALLERIIKAGSNEMDLVLDPFCGCGTSIAVAERLKRCWIGIDITQAGIVVIKKRLRDTFGENVPFDVVGEPVTLPDAWSLAKQDPYQFQWWALGLVGARPAEQKKGSDKGIDGRIYFHDEAKGGKTKQVILSVKAGHIHVSHIRDLRGVMEREKAEIGVFISMQTPTQPMRKEVAGAGFYTSPGWNQDYPRLQILTIADLLSGRKIDMPPIGQVNVTYKKAPRARGRGGEQASFQSNKVELNEKT